MAQQKGPGKRWLLEQRWREHIEAWRESGQTQLAFCRAHGLSLTAFSRWKIKLMQSEPLRSAQAGPQGVPSPVACSETVPWTEVRWPVAVQAFTPAQEEGFEVVLPRGWSVRLGPRFEADSLRRLLAVLEERSC